LTAPVGGAGEHRGADRVHTRLERLGRDPPQQRGEHLDDRRLGLAEQDAALVDPALRERLELAGRELRQPLGVATDGQVA
jgi:hypothetical protein